jgi:hypothetical protein
MSARRPGLCQWAGLPPTKPMISLMLFLLRSDTLPAAAARREPRRGRSPRGICGRICNGNRTSEDPSRRPGRDASRSGPASRHRTVLWPGFAAYRCVRDRDGSHGCGCSHGHTTSPPQKRKPLPREQTLALGRGAPRAGQRPSARGEASISSTGFEQLLMTHACCCLSLR